LQLFCAERCGNFKFTLAVLGFGGLRHLRWLYFKKHWISSPIHLDSRQEIHFEFYNNRHRRTQPAYGTETLKMEGRDEGNH
jgi:hypothetical protein